MFRQFFTLASCISISKASPGLKGQITKKFHSISYALPFSNNKMGSGSQSSGGIPDREALWERCGKDDRTFNALLKRYGDDEKGRQNIQNLLDCVEKGWSKFEVTSEGWIAIGVTPKGSEEAAKHEAEIHRESVY